MAAPQSPPDIQAAVAALRRGEVIGLPTETVYGLAADASNVEAVRRIFALKGRPADHPLIVHIADASSLSTWTTDASPLALRSRVLADQWGQARTARGGESRWTRGRDVSAHDRGGLGDPVSL